MNISFVYIYISNESESTSQIYWDDFKVTHSYHTKTQEDDYYPFGMRHTKNYTDTPENRHLFNAGSEFNAKQGVYNTPFRQYDPVLGRFNGIDAMASNFYSMSPYQFGSNSPAMANDPTGLYPSWYTPGMEAEFAQAANEGAAYYLPGGGGSDTMADLAAAFWDGWGDKAGQNYDNTTKEERKASREQKREDRKAKRNGRNEGPGTADSANLFASIGNESYLSTLINKQTEGLRNIVINIGGTPVGEAITWAYPDRSNLNTYLVPTYNMAITGTDEDGNKVSKTFEIIRFGVHTNKDGSVSIVGLADKQSYTIKKWIPTYKVHSYRTDETGAWQIMGNYLVHDGPDDPIKQKYATAGCIEVCGGPKGFDEFNNTLLDFSGAGSLHELGSSGAISIIFEEARRPSLKLY